MHASPPKTKRRGRPPGRNGKLDEPLIVAMAAHLLEQQGADFSMRALARRLGTDPMAVYNYFPSKEALLRRVAAMLFAELDPARAPFSSGDSLECRLMALSGLYLGMVRRAPTLIRLMAQGVIEDHAAIQRFTALFARAVNGLGLTPDAVTLGRDVLVDYLHGYALAGHGVSDDHWRKGVVLIARALRA